MKQAYRLIALAFVMGVVILGVNPNEHVFASSATPHGNDAILLSCMDYRLIADVANYMQNQRHMKGDYDYVILAGASLGVNNSTFPDPKFPDWGPTFWQHLETAITLHHIHKVMILDHRNCGAYKVILGKKGDFPENPTPEQLKEETRVHKEQLDALAKAVHQKHPELQVETLLMNLDGTVEVISAAKH